jgi:hypothetical protein
VSEPITILVTVDAEKLAAAVKPDEPQIMAGLTSTEVFELIEQTSRYYKALEEIRHMVGTGADQIAARALGRNS